MEIDVVLHRKPKPMVEVRRRLQLKVPHLGRWTDRLIDPLRYPVVSGSERWCPY